jgi:hypothetical protein
MRKKTIGELEVYEVLIISLIGVGLANLVSDSVRTLFYSTFGFNPNSFKDSIYTFILPLLLLFVVIFVTKPKETSLF